MWLGMIYIECKTLEDSWAISFKTKHEIIVCLAITHLGHLSQRNENVGSQKTSMWVFIEALLVAESVRLSFSGHSRRVTLCNTSQQCKETEQMQATWNEPAGKYSWVSKASTKGFMVYDSTCIMFGEWSHFWNRGGLAVMVGMIVGGKGRKGLMDILVMLSPLCGWGGHANPQGW